MCERLHNTGLKMPIYFNEKTCDAQSEGECCLSSIDVNYSRKDPAA